MDLTDRSLRYMVSGLGGTAHGSPRETGFDITVASEIMAILCLADGLSDLRQRLARIIVGRRTDMSPVTVRDLGAEKFLDIKCRQTGLRPDAAVLVCTVRALKMQGGVPRRRLATPDLQALRAGAVNLERQIRNLRQFGLVPVVCINRFATDSEEELALIQSISADWGVRAVPASHWAMGGAGAMELAQAVLDQMDEGTPEVRLLYEDDLPLVDKIETIATRIYDAERVEFTPAAKRQLEEFEQLGFGHLPVCIAKTQYSFSADPALRGAPSGHVLPVREVRLSAGAGFVVAVCGDIMTMPGLPRRPAALDIALDEHGQVTGLA